MIDINDPVAGWHNTLEANYRIARRRPILKPSGSVTFQPPRAILLHGFPGSGLISSMPERPQPQSKRESLGAKVVEGLLCDGTRTTVTYSVGSMGNDGEVVAVFESWVSQELGLTVLRTISEPWRGETVTRLTEIDRSEPDPALFKVPPDFLIQEVLQGASAPVAGPPLPAPIYFTAGDSAPKIVPHTHTGRADKPRMIDFSIPLSGMQQAAARLNQSASRVAQAGLTPGAAATEVAREGPAFAGAAGSAVVHTPQEQRDIPRNGCPHVAVLTLSSLPPRQSS